MVEHEGIQGKRIVFFDGVCGLCNGSVDFLIRIDTKNQLFFSPQQGQLFQSPFIQKLIRPDMGDSIFYLKDQTIYFKSDAIIHILIDVGGVWKVAWLFNIIPLRVRNLVYDFIAQNRYRWFGKKNQCRVPSWKEKVKFLD